MARARGRPQRCAKIATETSIVIVVVVMPMAMAAVKVAVAVGEAVVVVVVGVVVVLLVRQLALLLHYAAYRRSGVTRCSSVGTVLEVPDPLITIDYFYTFLNLRRVLQCCLRLLHAHVDAWA